MKKELRPRKLEQVSRLTGKEADSGLTFETNEPATARSRHRPAGPEETAASKR